MYGSWSSAEAEHLDVVQSELSESRLEHKPRQILNISNILLC